MTSFATFHQRAIEAFPEMCGIGVFVLVDTVAALVADPQRAENALVMRAATHIAAYIIRLPKSGVIGSRTYYWVIPRDLRIAEQIVAHVKCVLSLSYRHALYWLRDNGNLAIAENNFIVTMLLGVTV